MPLFSDKAGERRRLAEARESEQPQDVKLKEELSELVATGMPREVDQALDEAERAVNEATRADIRGIKMLSSGRCPRCSSRTENFLYTAVCTACGWYRRQVPESGHCQLHLTDGNTLTFDIVFPIEGQQFLCVNDGVVRAQIMQPAVSRIDYVWDDEELASARDRAQRERDGVCSWCDNSLLESEDKGPFDEYVAFGAMQEHYVFCSLKCLESFRKQYPPRIHRNCYETECAACDQCIKRYDMRGYKRKRTT